MTPQSDSVNTEAPRENSPLPAGASTPSDTAFDRTLYSAVMTLAAACGLFLALLIAFGNLSAGTKSSLFALCLILLTAVAGIACLVLRPLFHSREYTLGASVLLLLALLLRLSLFDHISGDYVSFLSEWTQLMRNMSVREALITPIGDYNMPYLYALLLISRLPFYDLYCIKLLSVAADVAAALAIGRLAALVSRSKTTVLLAFAAALLAPTTWLNSAYWGQCDSVYGALALWGLYYGLSRQPRRSMVLFALALSFKLQAIFLLPIAVFLLMTRRVGLRHLPYFPAAFLVAMLPALLAGRSLHDTFSIYYAQTQAYPYLSLNAPSFWSLIPNEYFTALSPAPVLLAMIAALLLLWLCLRKYRSLDTQELLRISLIFCLMIPWLLPRMHERYFYLAEMLSVVWAAARPREIPVSAVLLSGGFLIYSVYLFGGMGIASMQLVAVAYGAVLLFLLVRCRRRLYPAHHHTALTKQKEEQ